MSVALKSLDGVGSVSVSLDEGVASISLAPDNEITIAMVRQIVRDNGFTPKEAEVRIRGLVVAGPDGPMLRIPGAESAFRLDPHPDAPEVLLQLAEVDPGDAIVIEGVVPEDRDSHTPADVILVQRRLPDGRP